MTLWVADPSARSRVTIKGVDDRPERIVKHTDRDAFQKAWLRDNSETELIVKFHTAIAKATKTVRIPEDCPAPGQNKP